MTILLDEEPVESAAEREAAKRRWSRSRLSRRMAPRGERSTWRASKRAARPAASGAGWRDAAQGVPPRRLQGRRPACVFDPDRPRRQPDGAVPDRDRGRPAVSEAGRLLRRWQQRLVPVRAVVRRRQRRDRDVRRGEDLAQPEHLPLLSPAPAEPPQVPEIGVPRPARYERLPVPRHVHDP